MTASTRRRQAPKVQDSVNFAHEANSKQKLTSKGFQRHFVKHDYHDFARYQPSDLEDLHLKPVRGRVQSPFPVVLHRMLEDVTKDKNLADIVSWQPHGRAFLICQAKAFVASVLPKYFKHSKLSSFQRQLSLYGFIRLTHAGADRGAYYHEAFLRGREFLCSKIRRTRIKGTWIRNSSSPEAEPNFYLMEPVFDLHQAPSNTSSLSKMSDDDSLAQSFDTLLQAPPKHPSSAPLPLNAQDLSLKKVAPMQTQTSLTSLRWPPKVVEYDNVAASNHFGFGGGSFSFPSMSDNDLAQFLTGIDLDAEIAMNEVVQINSV